MKKLACLFALFVLIGLIFTSCKSTETSSDNNTGETENVKISKNISDYITETDNKKYIVLPKSKVKVHIQEEYLTYVDKIDVDLLISAEEKISKQIKEYNNKSGLYLDVWEDYLCLSAEVIVELEPDLVEGESGAIFDHEHKFFRERITKEKLGTEYYANHVLGTRIWDSQHPSDIDKREVIDVIIPELDGLKIEYDTMNSKVTVDENDLLGSIGNYCVGFYYGDLTGDGCPELCFVSSFGSGIVNESIVIYDAANKAFIYILEDRGIHDYRLFLRNNVLCVKEIDFKSGDITRTGTLGNNGKGITVFWDHAPNADFDK